MVVPAYNDAATLRATLRHLAAQTLAPAVYEVVVVDDGSTDDTPAVLAAAATGRARVRPVRLDRNRGRSAARNAGIRAAEAPIIVFVDSDVLVRPDFLQRHLALHQAAGRPVVGRGPVVLVPSPQIPPRAPAIRSSPAYLDTANASVPRQALVDAGLFDEGFRVYGWEDFDLGLRLQAAGLPRRFDPEAIGFHVQPLPDPSAFDRFLVKEEERARTALYLLRKHPGPATRWMIQDTAVQRAAHFVLGGAGLLTSRNAPRVARWLVARGQHTLANLVLRGALNRHYLASLDRFRAALERG
ncbi:MAG: glycosyltransferase family A protein [Armatimonadota bacterium]|nr:glycosyltransferase family A protein [Armatimonadota bacterium]MDR7455960.1 glycosyltransferase family A protein [Armatimonadota bacterium]MDR7496169.1 glycosyltransferase family A protein [Armatimonadota bacterium]